MIWGIKDRGTFLLLKNNGVKVSHDSVTMIFLAMETQHPQVAFALNKKFGSAVNRNRARRRIKEAFVQIDSKNPVLLGAYLLLANPKIIKQPYNVVVNNLMVCFEKLSEKK